MCRPTHPRCRCEVHHRCDGQPRLRSLSARITTIPASGLLRDGSDSLHPDDPDSDPDQPDSHHAHASPAPDLTARDHRDHPGASARVGIGSARNTRFGRHPDGHRPDRHQCFDERGMGRPRRRAVNLLPEGLPAWDGISRPQQFHPDVFAQRGRSERQRCSPIKRCRIRSRSRSRADLRRLLRSPSTALSTRQA
jgi:hypothetical protein